MAAPDRFFYLTRDDVLARLQGGWRSQVWQPEQAQWVDYPDLDVAGEGTEITEAAAQVRMGHGEFSHDPSVLTEALE